MRKVIPVLLVLILGALVGSGVTLGVQYARDTTPHYDFLREDLNQPIHAIYAERRLNELARNAQWYQCDFIYDKTIVVYASRVRPQLAFDGIFMEVEISIRPYSDPMTTDEVRKTWEDVPIEARTKAYESVCSEVVNNLCQFLDIKQKDKVHVLFSAGTVTPRALQQMQFSRDMGTFSDGKATMTKVAGSQPARGS